MLIFMEGPDHNTTSYSKYIFFSIILFLSQNLVSYMYNI
jgi:hypothetical protein